MLFLVHVFIVSLVEVVQQMVSCWVHLESFWQVALSLQPVLSHVWDLVLMFVSELLAAIVQVDQPMVCR